MRYGVRTAIRSACVALLAAALSSCSGGVDPVATGMASVPSESQLSEAESVAEWMASHGRLGGSRRAVEFSMGSEIAEAKDWDQRISSARFLMADYPVSDSKFPSLLLASAKARASAFRHYAKREYGDGSTDARRAASLMRQMEQALVTDVARVETECDCVLSVDGPLDTGVTTKYADVIRWIDGDTVETTEGIVRLIGIDAPELDESCSSARDAKANAEAMAPEGTGIQLTRPYVVDYTDKFDRILAYVEVERDDVTVDVGYSQILSRLAVARYDSRDGYQWHPREGDYRKSSTKVSRDELGCKTTESAGSYALDVESDYHKDYRSLRKEVAGFYYHEIADAADSADAARTKWQEHDDRVRAQNSNNSSGSSSGGGGGRYCRGWFCIG